MGQAKLRGTYEQRKAEGILKKEAVEAERELARLRVKQQERARRVALEMTKPKQAKREKLGRANSQMLMAVAAGVLDWAVNPSMASRRSDSNANAAGKDSA